MTSTASEGTLFQQAKNKFENLVPQCEILLNASQLEEHIDLYSSVSAEVNSLLQIIEKLRRRVNEADPNKQTYGPAMKLQIQSFLNRFDEMYSVYEEELQPNFEHLAQKKIVEQKLRKENEEKINEQNYLVARTYEKQEREREEREHELLLEKIKDHQMEEQRKEKQLRSDKLLEEERRRYQRDLILQAAACSILAVKNVGYQSHTRHGLYLYASHAHHNPQLALHLEPLLDLLTRITERPDILYYRVLRCFNNQFFESIGSMPGSTEVLMSAGFMLKKLSEVQDYVKQARCLFEKESGSPVPPPPNNSDELYWILEEPDPIEQFTEWTSFVERLNWVKNTVATVLEGARRNSLTNSITLLDEIF